MVAVSLRSPSARTDRDGGRHWPISGTRTGLSPPRSGTNSGSQRGWVYSSFSRWSGCRMLPARVSFTPLRYPIAKPIAQPPAAQPKTTSQIRMASNVHANEASDNRSQVMYWERTDPATCPVSRANSLRVAPGRDCHYPLESMCPNGNGPNVPCRGRGANRSRARGRPAPSAGMRRLRPRIS